MGANLLHLAQLGSTAPAEFLIASIWQGLLLAAVAWLGLELAPKAVPGIARKSSPRVRFTLWMIVFLLATLLPFATLLHRSAGIAPGIAPEFAQGRMHALMPAAQISAAWAVVLASFWALASLISLARLGWSGYRLHLISCSSTPVPREMLSEEIQAILQSSSARPVDLSLSSLIDCPMVIGFFHRTIVLPQWLWSKLTPSELSQIVLHEAAHLERGDDWTNLFQKFLRALFPLNPALFWAERRLCWEREMACDDAVLDRSVSPREYATCLTNLAEKSILNRLHSLAPGAWRRRSELAERVHRILKSNRGLQPLRSRPVVAAFLIALLGAGAALTRCPQIVTFTATGSSQASNETASLEPAVPAVRTNATSLDAPSSAHFVQASMRTAVPSQKPKPALHRAALRHRRSLSARLPHARFVRADWVQTPLQQDRLTRSQLVQAAHFSDLHAQLVQQPETDQDDAPQLFFTVYEVAPSLRAIPGDGTFQFATIHSQVGWIVIQL